MKYLLDTNIVITALAGAAPALRDRMAACSSGELVMSAIVYAELAFGSAHGRLPDARGLEALVAAVPVLPFDQAAAEAYARLPFRRRSFDRLIAAHAMALGLTLVTANLDDFADLDGLAMEDWTR